MSSFDEIIAQVRSKPLFSASELIEKFGWEEFFVFALMLGVSAAIGIFFWWIPIIGVTPISLLITRDIGLYDK